MVMFARRVPAATHQQQFVVLYAISVRVYVYVRVILRTRYILISYWYEELVDHCSKPVFKTQNGRCLVRT